MRRLPPSRVSQCIRKGVFGRVSLIGAICVRRGKEDWRANRRGPLAGIFEGWREIRGSNSISSIPRSPIVRSFRPTKKRGFDCIAASVVERERRWRKGLLSARSGFSWRELLAEMHIRFHYRCRRKVSRNLKRVITFYVWSVELNQFARVFAEDKESGVDYGRKLD